jgi:glycosyltransferase involved in cell wall biosynthesis
MNIGVDVRSLMDRHRTGVGQFTFRLLDALFARDRGHTFYLLYGGARDVRRRVELWQAPQVHYRSTRIPNKLMHAAQYAFGKPTLESRAKVPLDVLFFPNIHFGVTGGCASRVLTIHDLSFELFPQYLSHGRRAWHAMMQPRKQCEVADAIMVPSHHTKKDLVDVYDIDPKKIHVIAPGITSGPVSDQDVQAVREAYGLHAPYVLSVSTIEPRKNIDGLVEAFVNSDLAKQGFELILAGPRGWKYNDALSRIEEHSSIRYLEYVPQHHVRSLMAGAHVFAFPSFYEGFGFPPLEALSVGTPVIVGNRSSLPEVCGEAAVYVDPFDVDDIAGAMCELATNADVRQHIRARASTHLTQFTWEKTSQSFLSLLTHVYGL